MDYDRDIAPQVDHGVQLDRALGMVELRPGEQRQAEVDCGGVQSIGRTLEVGTEAVAGIEPPCDDD